jgi:hypothetical protein
MSRIRGGLLEILLDSSVVLLRGGEISGLQVGGELLEIGGEIGGGRSRGGNGLGAIGLKSGEIGLSLGEIAGLQILAELLKFLFEFLRGGSCGEEIRDLKETTQDAGDGHAGLLSWILAGRARGSQCAPIQICHRWSRVELERTWAENNLGRRQVWGHGGSESRRGGVKKKEELGARRLQEKAEVAEGPGKKCRVGNSKLSVFGKAKSKRGKVQQRVGN